MSIYECIGMGYVIFATSVFTVLIVGPATLGILRAASAIIAEVRAAFRDVYARLKEQA